MLKFTNHLSKKNLVLVRKTFSDGSCTALFVMRAPQRTYANPGSCPPPTEVKKSRKLLWTTIGATIITGSIVVYAKSSPETRNWLSSNFPIADDFIAVIYQENATYTQTAFNTLSTIKTYISNFMFGKEGITPLDIPPKSSQNIDKDAKEAFAPKVYELPPKKIEPLYIEETPIGLPEIESPAIVIQTEECEPNPPIKIEITKDVVNLEQEMHDNTKRAIDQYKEATKLCVAYNKALFRLIEAPMEEFDRKVLNTLASAATGRNKAVADAREASSRARAALEALDRMIQAGSIAAPPDTIAQTKRYIKTFRADLIAAEKEYQKELDRGVLANTYWSKVKEAREAYKTELKLLFPSVDLDAKQLDIKEDTDLLLIYTLRQVAFLQNELAEIQTLRDLKLNEALQSKNENAIIDVKVEEEYKKEIFKKFKEFQLQNLEIQATFNKKMKDALKRQADVHHDLMEYRLKRKEAEVLANLRRKLDEKMQNERVAFKKELAAMAGKLQAIEQSLRQRSSTEAEARRSQSVWAAAEALLAATKRDAERADIDKELKALEKAGKGDRLVQTVLKGIPPDAADTGVMTEKSVKAKFEEMMNTAKKVALIGRDGATLPVYFLSWLQSKLLFSKTDIPSDELENKPTDFSKLDTFDILQRARYHIDRNNIADALRYVNLLQGAPRAAARCWIEAAKRHLEIKQAAEAVMAHASVSGLLYL